jgi:hypothetical protein
MKSCSSTIELMKFPFLADSLSSQFGRSMKLYVLNVVACLLSTACDLPFEEELTSTQFLIRTGEHYASPRLMEQFNSQKLTFNAKFDESAMYDLGDPALQSNKNKLMGFSDCNSQHHANSARFAWQWLNNRLEIWAYCYVNSVRVEEFIATVNLNEEYLYEIVVTGTDYIFYLGGERKVAVPRAQVCSEGLNYMLYPYFGGTAPAPHDVRIEIQVLK